MTIDITHGHPHDTAKLHPFFSPATSRFPSGSASTCVGSSPAGVENSRWRSGCRSWSNSTSSTSIWSTLFDGRLLAASTKLAERSVRVQLPALGSVMVEAGEYSVRQALTGIVGEGVVGQQFEAASANQYLIRVQEAREGEDVTGPTWV